MATKQPEERNKITILLQGATTNVDLTSQITTAEFLAFKNIPDNYRLF